MIRNLRAYPHSEGGFIIHPDGNLVVGAGGIAIFNGSLTLSYDDLQINRSSNKNLEFALGGNFKAATIGIVSSDHITVSSGSSLNTLSDSLSSSVRQSVDGSSEGALYVPIEGVYIQQINENPDDALNITIDGDVATDGNLSIKSFGNVNLSSSLLAKKLSVLAAQTVNNRGNIQSNIFEVGAKNFINNNKIEARTVAIETEKNIFNSFGGDIQAIDIALKAPNGYVVNGSRSFKENYSESRSPLLISPNINSLKQGIFFNVDESGSTKSDASAHILANQLSVHAKYFENINPYFINKPSSSDWSASIAVNNQQSNQVSVQAETLLELKATTYGLNSSAILGLNQDGRFVVNAPKFSNERYKMEMQTYVYNQLALSDDKSAEYDSASVGTTSKIISYSPPGRLYSFGQFRFSNGNDGNEIDELFVNEMSYFEVFNDAHFHQTDIRSIGLEVDIDYDTVDLHQIRNCLTYRACEGEEVYTSAEAETLMSVSGSIYGIDDSAPSKSNLITGNIEVGPIRDRELVEQYLQQFIYEINEYEYGAIVSHSIDGDMLIGTSRACKFYVGSGYALGFSGSVCKDSDIRVSLSSLRNEDTEDRELADTGYTPAQFEMASQRYVNSLPLHPVDKSIVDTYFHSKVPSRTLRYESYALVPNTCDVVVGYSQINTYGGLTPYAPWATVSYTQNHSKKISIRLLMKFSGLSERGKCATTAVDQDPNSYTSAQYLEASKAYVQATSIDQSLILKKVQNTGSEIKFISYSRENDFVTINYQQIDSYYVGGYVKKSFTEVHKLSRIIKVTELMTYLP